MGAGATDVGQKLAKEIPHEPLAVCDATSVPVGDWFDYGLVHDESCPCCVGASGGTQDQRVVWYNYYLPFRASHRWFWVPRQKDYEILLFKTFDSDRSSPARFVAHSAFEVPDTPESAPERHSIECRVLCIW